MTAADPAVDVAAELARYSADVRLACEEFLPHEGSDRYLRRPATDYLDRAAKGIRPALCLATSAAFGGHEERARSAAAAIELMHNAFLIRDDIEDESMRRRGAPTLHRLHGVPLAINAGDAVAVSALAALRRTASTLGPRLGDMVLGEFEFMARQTVDGQALELGWRKDNRLDLTPQDYLDVIMKKTCWYTTILPLRVGALIGSNGAADIEPMIAFGFALGSVFQIQDDILNVAGDPAAHGKEPHGDLYEGKRTLILVHLLTVAAEPDRRWLSGFLAKTRAERSEADVDTVVHMVDRYGSVAFAREFAKGIAGSARETFQRAFDQVPPSRARDFIAGMIPYMIEREW